MASKASMLKSGVRKTGTGLFAGMQAIKEDEVKEKVKLEKEEKTVEEHVVEKEETAQIVEEKPVVEKIVPSRQEQVQVNEYVTQSQVQQVPQQQTQQFVQAQIQPQVQQMTPAHIEQPIQQIQAQSVYTQPVQQVENVQKPKEKAVKAEKTSRYEKEKFLLLDIRGLRDYVEHMAKAANMSATKYIRNLIEIDMQQNMDIYEAHKALEERLKERR